MDVFAAGFMIGLGVGVLTMLVTCYVYGFEGRKR